MRPPIYARYSPDQLILRDELAIERTLLANERTLLAYLRSGVALLIAGATMIHFSQQGWFLIVGVACIPLGIAGAVVGVVRFVAMNKSIHKIGERLPNANTADSGRQPSPD